MDIDYKELGGEIARELSPMFLKLGRNIQDSKVDLSKLPKPNVTVNPTPVTVNPPQVNIPQIQVPTPEVTVNVPEMKFPMIPTPQVSVNVDEVRIKNLGEIMIPGIDYEEITRPLLGMLTKIYQKPSGGGGQVSQYISGLGYTTGKLSGIVMLHEDDDSKLYSASSTHPLNVKLYPAQDAYLAAIQNALTGLYTIRYDDAGSGITYIGKAAIGTATSSAAWLIKKLDESATPDFSVKWASGTFNQVWDDRVSLSYS